MKYISAAEAADKWGIKARSVQTYCKEGRVPGAKKFERSWMIPYNAEKPSGLSAGASLAAPGPYACCFLSNEMPLDARNADGVIDEIDDERTRLQYKGELAYLRGEYRESIDCFMRTRRKYGGFLGYTVAVLSAVRLCDFDLYNKIKDCFSENEKAGKNDGGGNTPNGDSFEAQLIKAAAAVETFDFDNVPDWVKNGEFGFFPLRMRQTALYFRMRYLAQAEEHETAYAIAKAYISVNSSPEYVTANDVYFRLICACACNALREKGEARRYITEAMDIGFPHGFITPYTDMLYQLSGLIEECAENISTWHAEKLISIWERDRVKYIDFYNRYFGQKRRNLLTRREYHIARLIVKGMTYGELSGYLNISRGRVNNIVADIYGKYNVHSRDELKKYIF